MSEIMVARLVTYPIKSCAGLSLSEMPVETTGFQYDRQWMLVDDEGCFMSQRKNPELALVHPSIQRGWYGAPWLSLTAPQMLPIDLPIRPPEDTKTIPATVHGNPITGQEVSPEISEWFSTFLETSAKLVKVRPDLPRYVKDGYHKETAANQVGFADGFPLSLASLASLREINSQLEEPVPMDRFRPNIIVDGENLEPFVEDEWRTLRIGNMTAFVVKACDRCAIIDNNQLTGQPDGRAVRSLLTRTRRGIDVTDLGRKKSMFFMQNLLHEMTEGLTVRVGDTVEVVEHDMEPNIEFLTKTAG